MSNRPKRFKMIVRDSDLEDFTTEVQDWDRNGENFKNNQTSTA